MWCLMEGAVAGMVEVHSVKTGFALARGFRCQGWMASRLLRQREIPRRSRVLRITDASRTGL